MPRRKQKSQHYVDNKKFLEALINHKERIKRAASQDKPKPRIPEYVGDCFLKIATHLSYRPNFINYMYKEDMVSDGIENCVQYIDNFDPNKSVCLFYTNSLLCFFKKNCKRKKTAIYQRKNYREVWF